MLYMPAFIPKENEMERKNFELPEYRYLIYEENKLIKRTFVKVIDKMRLKYMWNKKIFLKKKTVLNLYFSV